MLKASQGIRADSKATNLYTLSRHSRNSPQSAHSAYSPSGCRYGNAHNAHEHYELEKRIWASQHPEATPAEYSAAILEIARRVGI